MLSSILSMFYCWSVYIIYWNSRLSFSKIWSARKTPPLDILSYSDIFQPAATLSLFNDSGAELKDHNRALKATPAICRHLSPTTLTQGMQTQTALLTPTPPHTHTLTHTHTHTHAHTHSHIPYLAPHVGFTEILRTNYMVPVTQSSLIGQNMRRVYHKLSAHKCAVCATTAPCKLFMIDCE